MKKRKPLCTVGRTPNWSSCYGKQYEDSSKSKNGRFPAKMEAQADTLCLLTQPKEGQQQFTKKKQLELTENQTVWKSNNQDVKEEPFIQTGRRSRDGQQRQRGNMMRQQLEDQEVPHSHANENQKGHLWIKQSQPRRNLITSGYKHLLGLQ